MEKETKKNLLRNKSDVLKAQHDYDLFRNTRLAAEEILCIVQQIPEAKKNKELFTLFEEVFDNLHEGEFKTIKHLDACEAEYISALEEMADEEELFFVDDFGKLDFPDDDNEEPEEE